MGASSRPDLRGCSGHDLFSPGGVINSHTDPLLEALRDDFALSQIKAVRTHSVLFPVFGITLLPTTAAG